MGFAHAFKSSSGLESSPNKDHPERSEALFFSLAFLLSFRHGISFTATESQRLEFGTSSRPCFSGHRRSPCFRREQLDKTPIHEITILNGSENDADIRQSVCQPNTPMHKYTKFHATRSATSWETSNKNTRRGISPSGASNMFYVEQSLFPLMFNTWVQTLLK